MRTSVCASVRILCLCLSVHEDISGVQNHTLDLYQCFFVHVAYCRSLVLLRRGCDALSTSGFVNDIMFLSIIGCISL